MVPCVTCSQQEWKEGAPAVPSALGTPPVDNRSAPLMQHFCASTAAFLRSWQCLQRSHFNKLWAERREPRRQSLLFTALSPRLPLCFSYRINKTNKVNKQRMQSLVCKQRPTKVQGGRGQGAGKTRRPPTIHVLLCSVLLWLQGDTTGRTVGNCTSFFMALLTFPAPVLAACLSELLFEPIQSKYG